MSNRKDGKPRNTPEHRTIVPRVCPWCGKVFKNHFSAHLKFHGKTWEDYTLSVTGLTEIPTCARPGCDNKVRTNVHDRENFMQYCCNDCSDRDKPRLGLGGLLPQNWEKYDIYNKMMEGKRKAFGSTCRVNGDPNKIATLYAGLCTTENKVKIGFSSRLNSRINFFKSKGLVFDELLTLRGSSPTMGGYEKELVIKYKNFQDPLDSVKYPYDKTKGPSCGNSEWFSVQIWDDLKKDFERFKSSTTIESSDEQVEYTQASGNIEHESGDIVCT